MPRISALKESLADRLVFADSEPFHITVKAAESGCSGTELAELLRSCGVECEYADDELLVLLMSPFSPAEDYERLRAVAKLFLLFSIVLLILVLIPRLSFLL